MSRYPWLIAVLVATSCCLAAAPSARATCSSNSPSSNTTVTCADADTTGINGIAGVSNVEVIVTGSGSIVVPANRAITARGTGWTVNNQGTVTGVTGGIFTTTGAGSIDINNSGTVSATGASGNAIDLINGGAVTNTGTISGTRRGYTSQGAVSSLDNFGTVRATELPGAPGFNPYGVIFFAGGSVTNATTGVISSEGIGVRISGGSAATNIVTNSGLISGGQQSATGTVGVYISGGGTITNNSTGTITALHGGAAIDGGDGTVINHGSIIGTATSDPGVGSHYGVFLSGGAGNTATIVNTGTIRGWDGGVHVQGETATLTNSGTITGCGCTANPANGVHFEAGGTVVNQAGGVITGEFGAAARFDGANAAALVNFGTLNGDVIMGLGDDAITLAAGSSTNGNVDGRGGTDVLSLIGGAPAITMLSSNVSNVESLAVNAPGATWILSGAGTFSSGVTITAGTLQIGDGGTTGLLTGDVVNNGTLAFNRLDALSFGGTISGTGGLLQIGGGITTLTAANSYTGGTTIGNGTLSVSADANLGGASGGLTLDGGTLMTTAAFSTGRSVTLVAGGGVFQTDADLTVTGMISGTGMLTKDGAGTLTLSGANTYGGGTTVIAGTLIGNATSIRGDIDNDGAVVFDQNVNATFTGDIGGSGAMVKEGAGTLTLAGQSTLDWSVDAGSLVSAAERFGGDVAIGPAASFTFNQFADASYGGTISGAGDFVKAGMGSLTLTGNSGAFAGTTTLEAGTLAVNGILGGAIDVLSGARLQGTGTVGTTTVASGGTIAPGNSIGTLTVQGGVTFAAGSTYEVEINAAGENDLIDATGAATLEGGTVEVVPLPGFALATPYTILTAAGGLTGTFDSVAMASPSLFLAPKVTYDANNAFLSIAQSASFASAAQTPNQMATAVGIDSLGAGNDLWNAVALLGTQAEAQAAYDALSGEIHASTASALIDDSRFVRTAANDRVRAAFDGVAAPAALVLAYGEGGPTPAPAATDRFATWGQAFGSWGRWDGDGNAAGFDRSIGGFFLGADAPFGDSWRLGLIAGYSRTDFDVEERASSGDSDDIHLGVYGGTQFGEIGLRFGGAYSWHDIDVGRTVAFPGFSDALAADYNAGTAQVFADAGYQIKTGAARFEPFANLAYVNLRTDGFTETGGAAALTAASSTQDTTFSTLGVRAETGFAVGDMMARVRGSLGWQHAFGDVIPTASLNFAGGSTFSIAGTPIVRDAAVVEAGFALDLSRNASLAVSYNGQIGSGVQDHGVNAALSVSF